MRGNKLDVTKLELPPLGEELKELFDEVDRRYKRKRRPTEREILASSFQPRMQRRQFYVARLARIPYSSRPSTANPDPNTDPSTLPYYRPQVSTDINIVMDPKPFPRRFLGRIRSLTSTICNHGT